MIRILTSSFNNYVEENGIKIPRELDNINGIIDTIKNSLKDNKLMVFIPSDPCDKVKTKSYSDILFESFKLSGINFLEYHVLNDNDNVKEILSKADLVFLSGGDTYIQNKYFSKINLKQVLHNYKGLVIGQSAGTINMATSAYNSPEEMEKSEPIKFKGLGLTDINVEPHFILDETDFTPEQLYQREDIMTESYERTIYGQCDGSYIVIDDKTTIYGETYLIEYGSIKLICNNKESKEI